MDETKNPDCKGPYIVVQGNYGMDSSLSPHIVICASHIEEWAELIESGEPLAIGEPGYSGLNSLANNEVPVKDPYFDNSATVIPAGLLNLDDDDGEDPEELTI
jgi:hypothetical protein